MTPRDKDFITRYQLSQIVTEDPYNEDFYFQVYKIIQRGGITSESNKGLIARRIWNILDTDSVVAIREPILPYRECKVK